MKVSVIIPTYNRAQYICQAIDSVLDQTFADIEIIVVDDGSIDSTEEEIKPYGRKIVYIRTQNGGPAHARNIGMSHARGEYVSFLDSDDLYYPYKTELQVKFLDKFPEIGMVYTELSVFDDNGFEAEYYLNKYHRSTIKKGKKIYDNIFSEKLTLASAGLIFPELENRDIYMGNIFDAYFDNIIVFTNSIMFRKKILETIGMQDERWKIFEELEFTLRLCKHCKVAFIDVQTYKLRYHTDQISEPSNGNDLEICITKQRNLTEIAEKHGVLDIDYYLENKDRVNKRMAILHRSVAIPLLAKGNDPVEARYHLMQCACYGYPERLLKLFSLFPYLLRRVMMKIYSVLYEGKRSQEW